MDQAVGSGKASKEQVQLRLFLEQRANVLRYVMMITRDAALAEDVVQEVWMRYSAAAATQAIRDPDRFLFRVARNLALDWRRRRGFEEKLFTEDSSGPALFVASDAPDPERSVGAADELAFILSALDQLPERTRQAFLLHRMDGMTLVEIGARLNISKSVAHELIVDAVQHCRQARDRAK